jgi:hypothetical protein
VTYSADKGDQWNTVSLSLPRQSLVSYLGFEPQGGLYRSSGTPAGRLLFDLIWTSDNAERSTVSPADSYMQLAVYDLVGALFAPSEPLSGSRHADKLFAGLGNIIKDGFADPSFGPHEVAAEAGISEYSKKATAVTRGRRGITTTHQRESFFRSFVRRVTDQITFRNGTRSVRPIVRHEDHAN